LTYEPEGYDNLPVVQECGVPKTTSRLIVELWGHGYAGSAAVPLLRREFDYAYTFVPEYGASNGALRSPQNVTSLYPVDAPNLFERCDERE
jgi:hypothetical protein